MAASASELPAIQRLLREEVRRDDRRRELAVAGFIAVTAALCGVISLALIPLIGAALGLSLFGAMLALIAWYGSVWRVLSRGWFHPAIQWVHVALEVSVPTVIFALDTRYSGAEYALSAPPLLMWGGLIVLAGLRMRRSLAVGAGVLAAAEYLALYFLYIQPQLPEGTLVTFGAPFILIRAFFLVATGALTALVAHLLLEKAEAVLKSVRARDLMGKYVLKERIGAGGMAEVFLATYSPEGGFERTVAVKRILPDYAEDELFAQLFRREAQLGSLLQHPNVVQILDMGTWQGTLFLAMEYVEGLTVRRLLTRLRGRPLPLRAVTYLGAELASALTYIHERSAPDGSPLGLIHRDLNPPNVLLSRHGEVKLGDFGVARSGRGEQVTRGDVVRGKVGYMAPEQQAGEDIDARIDLFALGLTLHEALTGTQVYEGKDEEERAAAIDQPVRPPSHVRPDVPPELDRVVMGLLEHDRGRRIGSGAAARAMLLQLPESAAPYPAGKGELVTVIEAVLAEAAHAKAARIAAQDAHRDGNAPDTEPMNLPLHRAPGRR